MYDSGIRWLAVSVGGAFLVLSSVPLRAEPRIDDPRPQRPKALLALEEYRSRHLDNGEVSWSFRTMRHPSGALHYTSRFTIDSQLLVDRGSDDGFAATEHDGTPSSSRGAHYTLVAKDGGSWETDGESVTVRHIPPDSTAGKSPAYVDVRTFDISVEFIPFSNVHDAIWKAGLEKRGAIAYEETREGDQHVVTVKATSPDGRKLDYAYWLDAKRGWSPVRTEYRVNGSCVKRSRIVLRDYDGVWFPEVISRFADSFESGEKPVEEITIQAARFGRDVVKSLNLKDIGVEVGTNIVVSPTPSKPAHCVMWDGTKGVDPDEFSKRLSAGELVRGPNFMKAVMRDTQGVETKPAAAVAGRNTQAFAEKPVETVYEAWEQYVKTFIKEHELTGAQQGSAMAILADCRKQSQQYVQSKRDRFDELRKLRDAVRELFQMKADTTAKTRQMVTLAEELAKPLDNIFENHLKPRLLGLLTAEQSKAARPPTATQPRGG